MMFFFSRNSLFNMNFTDYKLNKYDDSMVDCTKVLSNDPHHIKGLTNYFDAKFVFFLNNYFI